MSTGPTILCFPLFFFPVHINAITCFDFNKSKIINSLNQQGLLQNTLMSSQTVSSVSGLSPPRKTMNWVQQKIQGFYG